MRDRDVPLEAERRQPLQEVAVGDCAGRVVRVAADQQVRALRLGISNRREVGKEPALGEQRHRDRLGSGERRPAAVDGISRVGDQRGIAGIELRHAQVGEPLLGAEQRHHLALGVEHHPEPARVVPGDRLAQLLQPPVGRVHVRTGPRRLAAEHVGELRRRGHVGIAHAERDHVDAGGTRLGDTTRLRGRRGTREARQAGARSARPSPRP